VFAITSAARDLSGGVRAIGPNGRIVVTPSQRGGRGVDALVSLSPCTHASERTIPDLPFQHQWEFIPTEEEGVFKIKGVQFGGFVTTVRTFLQRGGHNMNYFSLHSLPVAHSLVLSSSTSVMVSPSAFSPMRKAPST